MKVLLAKISMIGTASTHKNMNRIWNNKDLANCAGMNFAVASVIIDSIYSFVSENFAFKAACSISASLLYEFVLSYCSSRVFLTVTSVFFESPWSTQCQSLILGSYSSNDSELIWSNDVAGYFLIFFFLLACFLLTVQYFSTAFYAFLSVL